MTRAKHLDPRKDAVRNKEPAMKDRLTVLADTFFKLVADGGRFQMCQLYRYAELQLGAKLERGQLFQLRRYVESVGAKPERASEIEIFVLPTSMRSRRAARVKREHKAAADLFNGK